MQNFFFKLLSLVLLGLTSVAHAAVAPKTPKEVVQTIIERAKALDDKTTRAQNEKVIESLVDFNKLADDALGDRKSDLTEKQRHEVRDLLRKIITGTVYPEAAKFFNNVTIQYTAEDTSGNRSHVKSVVTKGTKRSTVEYWLVPSDDTFHVADLAVEGEPWVENVHTQFDEIIGKYGVNGLITRMQKRLREIEKPKSTKAKS